jgi:hypothetical protein
VNINKAKLEGLFVDELARLQPTAGFMRLVKDRVVHTWREMKTDAAQRIAKIERKQNRFARSSRSRRWTDTPAVFNYLGSVSTQKNRIGGPDRGQLEPNDQVAPPTR